MADWPVDPGCYGKVAHPSPLSSSGHGQVEAQPRSDQAWCHGRETISLISAAAVASGISGPIPNGRGDHPSRDGGAFGVSDAEQQEFITNLARVTSGYVATR